MAYQTTPAERAHVHEEHYNVQVAIQHVVCDTLKGKTSTEMVRINLSTKVVAAATDEDLSALIRRVVRHLEITQMDKTNA